jgi:phenylpropionate dioxygenase-like ring-hydroxylating dioxygenase large terminal subunit
MGAIEQTTLVDSKELERCPFPVPTGWFFVDYSENLQPGELRNINFLDQEWVLFRTEGGKVGVSDPYCAHLGAHMGHGGKVCGEHLRCPFHHWEYGTTGFCRSIPYAKVVPPIVKKQAIMRMLPTQEKYGLIWAWHHPQNAAPAWELPEIPEMSSDEYIKPHRRNWPVNTAIQELAENGVDFAHLKFLHGSPIMPKGETRFDGPNLYIEMTPGPSGHQCGPGLAIFRFTHEGVTATMVSYSVPITREKTMMNMSFTHKKYPEGSKEGMIAQHLVNHMIGAAEGEASAGFESVDFVVWNNKKYRPKPLLCDGDGPILKYRAWFRQFYPGWENSDKI